MGIILLPILLVAIAAAVIARRERTREVPRRPGDLGPMGWVFLAALIIAVALAWIIYKANN